MILKNLNDTKKLAKKLASRLKPGQTVGFYGDLGAGKTTLVQMIAGELGVKEPVTSPTFVIQKNYQISGGELVHIDCYRLNTIDDVKDLGFEELFADPKKLVLIEWADRIEELLPQNCLRIRLSENDNNHREAVLENF